MCDSFLCIRKLEIVLTLSTFTVQNRPPTTSRGSKLKQLDLLDLKIKQTIGYLYHNSKTGEKKQKKNLETGSFIIIKTLFLTLAAKFFFQKVV